MPLADSKSVQVIYFPITTPADMVSALEQALSVAYYGIITMTAAGEWSVSLTGPGNARIDGHIGEVMIWNGSSLVVLSNNDFLAQYTPK